jgi:hypothetical protein
LAIAQRFFAAIDREPVRLAVNRFLAKENWVLKRTL